MTHDSYQTSNCQQCKQPKQKHCCEPVYRRNKVIDYVSYDEWLPNVRILVPEIPDSILLDYIRRGCIEFAKKSHILQRNIPILPEDCVADYYPCLGEEERIDIANFLSVNGDCYRPVGDTCSWQVGSYRYWFHPPSSLEIHPAPKKRNNTSGCQVDIDIMLNVKAVPSETSSVVDKIIYDRHFEAIENYAVAKGHLVPGKPATSGEAHTYRMNEFKKEVNKAKIDIARNYSSYLESVGGLHDCLC